MSADVHDRTSDKTMNANTNVKLANDDVWSVRSIGGTSTLSGDTGASETAYRRPHAPRSGKPKNAALIGLHFDISSTSELRNSATRRLRVSNCLPPTRSTQACHRTRRRHSTDQVPVGSTCSGLPEELSRAANKGTPYVIDFQTAEAEYKGDGAAKPTGSRINPGQHEELFQPQTSLADEIEQDRTQRRPRVPAADDESLEV